MEFAPNKAIVLLQLLLLVSVNVAFAKPEHLPPAPAPAHPPSHHHYGQPPAHPPVKPPVHPPAHPPSHHHHGPVHPPVKPPVHPPVKPPVHPPVYPPVKPPVHPPVKPPVHPPVKPPVHPPVKPPVHPPVYPPVKPPVHPPVKPPVHPPVYPPVKPPVHPPVSPPTRSFVAVQGVVYCESCKYKGKDSLVGAKPIWGAVVKLECKNSKYTVSQTGKTDKNGYFLIKAPKTVTSYAFHKCKVSLVSSPLKYCSTPAKLNGGKSGAVLKPWKPFYIGKLPFILYTVGPFAFEPTCPRV